MWKKKHCSLGVNGKMAGREYMARQLHDANGPVSLVNHVYRGEFGHQIVWHEERLLEKVPAGDEAFHLSHKMGIQSELYSLVFSLPSGGQTFILIKMRFF